MQWRWEALRTGRPYAEIVVLRSLLYRVEQVFLIHRESGLLLQHVAARVRRRRLETKDPEMVSGMLTAIQDFVHDSVSGTEGENLETIRMGDDRSGAGLRSGRDPGRIRSRCPARAS